MYTSHYFVELIVKERQKQLVVEADKSRLTKATKSTKTNNSKRISGSITGYVRTLGAILFRKHERMICRC